jgi:hypothetical protein
METTSSYTTKWQTSQKVPPYSPAFAKLTMPMLWCGVGLAVRVECTDGNIVISAGNIKTHIIHVQYDNIVAIGLTRKAVCISEDADYHYYRHVIEIKYNLSTGDEFCITINEDNYMCAATTNNVMVVMSLFDKDRNPKGDLAVCGNKCYAINTDKYELLESHRGWGKVIPREIAFSNTYRCPKIAKVVKRIGSIQSIPGTMFHTADGSDILVNGFDLICRLRLKGDKMLCDVTDVATKIRFNLEVPPKENTYMGPNGEIKKYYYNGPLGRNDPPIPFAIVTINYITYRLSHTEVHHELPTA